VNSRFGTKRFPPFEIAAGSSEPLECYLDFYDTGTFENQLHVYVDVGGVLHEFELKVHGTVQPAVK
jgi:hypothetical protein